MFILFEIKLQYATSAVELGVKGAFITDGRVPHALLKEVLAGGSAGTGSGEGGTYVSSWRKNEEGDEK